MNAIRRIGASLVVLLCILLLTSSAYATGDGDASLGVCESCWRTLFSIQDPQPPTNLSDAKALWDYRDTGEYQNTGAYFQVYVAVSLRDKLSDYDAVKELRVRHLETEREFSLIPDPCHDFLSTNTQYYYLLMQPEDWMFQGTWHITMVYKGSDRLMHRQTIDAFAGPELFPTEPTGITIKQSAPGQPVFVEWDGIGPTPPNGPYRYKVRIYTDEFCAYDVLGTPVYSSGRVTSPPIPATDIGLRLRLENRQYQGVLGDSSAFARALKILVLQPQ
jgi:hypothetical protein